MLPLVRATSLGPLLTRARRLSRGTITRKGGRNANALPANRLRALPETIRLRLPRRWSHPSLALACMPTARLRVTQSMVMQRMRLRWFGVRLGWIGWARRATTARSNGACICQIECRARDEARRCRLHDEIVAFYQYISPSPEEAHVRAMVIKLVSDAVHRRFPQGTVDTFGSVAQNLYLPDGCVHTILLFIFRES